jgi:hypothetical protein
MKGASTNYTYTIFQNEQLMKVVKGSAKHRHRQDGWHGKVQTQNIK